MKITDAELKKIICNLSGAKAEDIHGDTALIEDLHLDSLKLSNSLRFLAKIISYK